MNNLNVSTSQNVQITYQLAAIGERMVAYFIDYMIIMLYVFFIAILAFVLADSVLVDVFDAFDSNTGFDFVLVTILFIIFSPVMFYHLLCEQFMQGQTYGKKAMKIKVVKVDGSQPNFGNYFTRWIIGIVDALPYWSVGIISIIITKKSQRIGDIAAGTVVIKLTQKVTSADTIFQEVDENHVVKYTNALKLTDKDIELIKAVLNKTNSNNLSLRSKLANKVNEVIEANETNIKSKEFLNQVLKDYNHLCITEGER